MSLRWTPQARADVSHIYDWIGQHNPRAAAAVIASIRERAGLLGLYPGIGRETSIVDLRVLPITRYPYLIYHRLSADAVVIVHIRHSARDAPGPDEINS